MQNVRETLKKCTGSKDKLFQKTCTTFNKIPLKSSINSVDISSPIAGIGLGGTVMLEGSEQNV